MIKEKISKFLSPELKMWIRSFKVKSYLRGVKKVDPEMLDGCTRGVNIFGHIRGDFGLGESCRLLASAVKASGVPYAIINVPHIPAASETNTDWILEETHDQPYGINLIHINPMELVSSIKDIPKEVWSQHYNIAFWLWELPEFPPEWDYLIDIFDEIWTPSDFVSDAIRKRTDKRIVTIPYGIAKSVTDDKYDRAFYRLPDDKYLYLMSFDGKSNFERKNPLGSIQAYKRAFPKEVSQVGIVIKATNISADEREFLMREFDGYKNVYILEETLSKTQFNSLLKSCDCYISLHRSEGFGLVLAECMMLDTIVVATRWSANVEFMDDESSVLVDTHIIELDREYPPYHKGAHWAEPDIDMAAKKIRQIYDDEALRKKIIDGARQKVSECLSIDRAAQLVKARIDEIYRGDI